MSLLIDSDYHENRHTHRILDFLNIRALDLKIRYTAGFAYTAGYACPGDSGHSSGSQHQYGRAFDADGTSSDDAVNSKRNYDIYIIGRHNMRATFFALYDEGGNYYQFVPAWPDKPAGFVGDNYTHVHLDWR